MKTRLTYVIIAAVLPMIALAEMGASPSIEPETSIVGDNLAEVEAALA